MAAANTVATFVEKYGKLLEQYKKKDTKDPKATISQLSDVIDQVAAIANAPNSSLEVAAIDYKSGEEEVKASFKFKTEEARAIRDNASERRRLIEQTSNASHPRMLMVFAQTNVKTSKVGAKRTGDRVVIDAVSPGKDLPLVYASPMAEQEIKQEIRDAQDNIYRKAFEVGVNVEMRNGKPIAYRLTDVHDVLDLD